MTASLMIPSPAASANVVTTFPALGPDPPPPGPPPRPPPGANWGDAVTPDDGSSTPSPQPMRPSRTAAASAVPWNSLNLLMITLAVTGSNCVRRTANGQSAHRSELGASL